MLTPSVANRLGWLYAVGNTPATSLTRSIPIGQDAHVLALGCGDLRNVLYTAYADRGLEPRKLDITACDYDEGIICRNIILLTLILDGDDERGVDASLWDIYYHFYVDDAAAQRVLRQAEKLLPLLESAEAWSGGPYGGVLRFCDHDSLLDVRRVCRRIRRAARRRMEPAFREDFARQVEAWKAPRNRLQDEGLADLTAMRSAAPLAMQVWKGENLSKTGSQYWTDGTATPNMLADPLPNPLFAGLVSEYQALHYGTDPVLGFHLAAAFAPLVDHSPLKPKHVVPGFGAAAAAQTQFAEWVAAFRTAVARRAVMLRFAVAEALAFCHTLQHAAASGSPSAGWYRRQWELRPLVLDEGAYGTGREGPAAFDVVDTSNLSDHVGVLNVLIAAAPLMKPEPWAIVYTDLLIKRHESQQQAFEGLLCGHAPTVSLLLGVSPVQYWTNAKCESHVDEILMGIFSGMAAGGRETQLHNRLAWKRDDQFSGQLQGRGRLHIEAQAARRLLFGLYQRMFETENGQDALARICSFADAPASFARVSPYGHFHRGSFVALLKLAMSRVETDWPRVCSSLVQSIAHDRTLALSSNNMQELCLQMHLQGVGTEPWLLEDIIGPKPVAGPLKGWTDIPPAVAVTLVVPRDRLDRLYANTVEHKIASPTLVASLRASPGAPSQWHNTYNDVHFAFGTTVKATSAGEDGPVVIEEDELGWDGSSPLVVSWAVPTAALLVEPATALVGLLVLPSAQSTRLYEPILGISMSIFETTMGDEGGVFISRLKPGQAAHRVDCGGARPFDDAVGEQSKDQRTTISAEMAESETRVSTVTCRVEIASERGRRLLRDKVPTKLRQRDPFVLEVVFGGDKLVCPLRFPVPVTTVGSKSRIARTSGYVEVVVPLADPVASDVLADFVFPSMLSRAGVPVALNTPSINLDSLPILSLDDKANMQWLNTLTSLQFSAREKQQRNEKNATNGIAENTRVNFKESLFTMFMLVSGLQGGQTVLFFIQHPGRGGIHMILLVSALRLDGDAASVVLDAAVIPLTMDTILSGRIKPFLEVIQTLEVCSITVNDAELVLWKRVLPSLVERCRTWSHLPSCEYRRSGATVPLSVEPAEQVLCSCGNGKLPRDFVSLPEWEAAAPSAVRVAISPTYAAPFVEDVVDGSLAATVAAGTAAPRDRCHRCGKAGGGKGGEVALKKCMRCLEVRYCSVECQRRDWKTHRMECKEEAQ